MSQKVALKTILSNRYRGKHLVIAGGRIYTARTGPAAAKLFRTVLKKHPRSKLTVTSIPQADSWVFAEQRTF